MLGWLWKHDMNKTWTALALWPALAAQTVTAASPDCAGLRDVAIENATVTAVELVPEGPYKIRQGPRETSIDLPQHCRVAALLTPSEDSHIEMELWLPLDWNGKFLAVGNGGWAGSISYRALAAGLKEGYAATSNDTGHQDRGASFVMGHPEKLIDFAYRAMHEMTVQSKKLVRSFYQKEIQLSYYEGCSTGGRQGLMAAQRYPEDFDGVIAGAPANPMTEKHSGDAERSRQAHRDRKNLLSPAQLRLVHQAAVEACDSRDGVEDGLLSDPSACSFDPSKLLCEAGEPAHACLTAGQIESVGAAYGPVNDQNGDLIHAGYSPGSEMSWRFLLDGSSGVGTALDTFRYAVHGDPGLELGPVRSDKGPALGPRTGRYSQRQLVSRGVPGARGQNDSLSRLGRRGDCRSEHSDLSRRSRGEAGRRPARLVAIVHGSRHGALRGRGGTRSGELACRARAVGRGQKSA